MSVTRSATNTKSSEETMAVSIAVNLNRHLDAFEGTGYMADKNSKGSAKYRSRMSTSLKILPLHFSGPAEVWFMGLSNEDASNS